MPWGQHDHVAGTRSFSVLFNVFIYDCTGSLLLLELSLAVEEIRATLRCCCGLLTVEGSPVGVRGFQGLGSIVVACGPQLPGSTWDLPGAGIKLVSPAPQGRLPSAGAIGEAPQCFCAPPSSMPYTERLCVQRLYSTACLLH